MKNGTGKWFMSDGGLFLGEFKNDEANGRGMFVFGKSVEKLRRKQKKKDFSDSMLVNGVPIRLGNQGDKLFGRWASNKLVELFN